MTQTIERLRRSRQVIQASLLDISTDKEGFGSPTTNQRSIQEKAIHGYEGKPYSKFYKP
jgi:hypothetical protein